MGHRHLFNTSQMFDSDHDQNWNHMQAEQSFGHMGNFTIIYYWFIIITLLCTPVLNLSIFSRGIHFFSCLSKLHAWAKYETLPV